MTDLMRYAAELEGVVGRGPAPVEKWNPERVGAIDIVIQSDGTWLHEGAPIRRARLVKLFSTILKREGDDYFLVTPVEKLKITVEDAPFVAVLMEADGEGRDQRLIFTTNVGEKIVAGPAHGIFMRRCGDHDAPYIEARRGLEARVARAVFYDLVGLGERRHGKGKDVFGVWSSGVFFPLADADKIEA